MRFRKMGGLMCLVASAALISCSANPAFGYSVLAHEAIVDRAWEDAIKPLLLRRFPRTTADQLVEARAYAYGGCAIQDLGYYPFSSRYFSDLTHYVSSGILVEALIRDAADVDEYAFALGALSHYAADIAGHSIAINKSVPLLYSRLRSKYGNDIAYGDNAAAHIQTEFGFDVIQVASGNYASNSYHRFVGFKVSKRLLERAFFETYGIELKSIFTNVDLALESYRISVGSLIPEMTRVAWEMKKHHLQEQFPGITQQKYGYAGLSHEPQWPGHYKKSGPFARTTALWFRIVPRIGMFRALAFKQPTPEAESLFIQSLDVTLDRYRELLKQVGDGSLALEDTNLDTGRPARLGDYRLADQAYARLLNDLGKKDFRNASEQLKEKIVSFYGSDPLVTGTKSDPWNRTHQELDRLRKSQAHLGGRR